MSTPKGLSLTDLDATLASASAFEFEYEVNGSPTGVFFSVLGSQAEEVVRELSQLVNTRRRKEAARSMKGKNAEIETFESDLESGARLAAIRLVGWRGIVEPFSRENALILCQSNPDIAARIIEQSDMMGNFIKL